jgi:signal transduction histidine kinase
VKIRRALPPRLASVGRVAIVATLLIAGVYGACIIVLDKAVASRLVAEADARLRERLSDIGSSPAGQQRAVTDDDDDDEGGPLLMWLVAPGRDTVRGSHTPALPAGLALPAGRPVSARIGSGNFRLMAVRRGGALVVAGQSLAEQDHIERVLVDGEALAAPVLLLAMFAGSVVIGLKALSPVEQSRRRQLEFTADASHELRTPLSVISAETSIALSSPRSGGEYRATLGRIQAEGHRLRSIVEDLLWLARFDSRPPPPGDEPLDLATIAEECADRFGSVAHSQSLSVLLAVDGPSPAWISAPPEWIDRLAGVLMDNACRYAGPGGKVRIGVLPRGGRVSLVVEDSGPGIPAVERPLLFDRFHRATERGGGAGLGLAIGDSIVRSTGGHWRIGESPLGGAMFEVSWRRSSSRQHAVLS